MPILVRPSGSAVCSGRGATTSVQYLVDLAFNPNDDEIWLFGLRVRMTL